MLLNFSELLKKYNAKPSGVIVAGSHWGEEHDDYVKAGIRRMAYIEPCAAAFDVLRKNFFGLPEVQLFNLAVGDKAAVDVEMYTGDNTVNKGQSNSLLRPSLHLSLHPEVEFNDTELVDVELLDNLGLAGKGFDLLVMDCQGYEDRVLRGAIKTLKHINWVYTEVNMAPVYENNAMIEDVDELLADFKRVETGPWVGGAWSDSFYVRKSLLHD
jgi:FkbM family methyltransferase